MPAITNPNIHRATVVTLGDLSRSPRMLYHAQALASVSVEVDLVGYQNSAPLCCISKSGIRLHRLASPSAKRHRLSRLGFLAYSLGRVVSEHLSLLWLLLFRTNKPDVILVQTPPAIPTLLTALIAARLRSARLVIDWHNFGYTMLALRLPPTSLFVRFARWYERVLGKQADTHLCVSNAMRMELAQHWEIPNAVVMYDRPAAIFSPTPVHIRHDLFRRLGAQLAADGTKTAATDSSSAGFPADGGYRETTLITTLSVPATALHGDVRLYCHTEGFSPPAALRPFVELRADRPALLVSSTSWSADEDFSILIEALVILDALGKHTGDNARQRMPRIQVVITGDGPLRRTFEQQVAALALEYIQVCTVWLSAEDYPRLLGSADVGLCFHRSSSGVDLPMKVADMFGCGLPVCALDYGPCLAEQMRHGENGLLFSTGAQLAEQIHDLFKDFPAQTPLLDRLRHKVAQTRGKSWLDEWRDQVLPVIGGL